MQVPNAYRSQKKVSDPLEQELQRLHHYVNHLVGAMQEHPRASARAKGAFNHESSLRSQFVCLLV